MVDDFLGKLLGNPARAKLLRVFVLNGSEAFTAAAVGKRAGVASAAAQKEIKVLEQLSIVKKGKLSITLAGSGKRVAAKKQKEPTWTLNHDFKHAAALSQFVHQTSPVEYKRVLAALKGAGRIATVVLSGSFTGDPVRPADIIVAGDGINESRLDQAIKALEPVFGWEIRYAAFTTPEFRYRLTIQDRLIRDTLDYPHVVLVDKTGLL
ncbi:MAG: helix-turn-helix transcriptional regulator [Candidatus Kaiserbacteria bacterium]|nr:MAG: helix-turn-helix transcriptional regulator [Candidatus Kaiserbacteria bacterium]